MKEMIDELKKIEGISKKNAERIIFDLIIHKEKQKVIDNILTDIKNNYSECEKCYFFKKNNYCSFCDNINRNQKKICVVSNKMEAQKILESSYDGQIHILNGEINLSKNIGPEKLKIKELFAKINKDYEVLLALNFTIEGEITANYIANLAKKITPKVFRIAKGISLGAAIDYIDLETLNEAISNRKKI